MAGAAQVVTIAQQKGGAGKTTLAIHLAIQWSRAGRKVAVLDIDPQQSLSRWGSLRRDKLGLVEPQIVTATGWRTAGEVDKLSRSHDLVVIDSPPHTETEARVAVRAASLVVVPVQPSVMDLWAVTGTLDLAKAEKVPVLLVLNRMPPRSKVADTLAEEAAKLGVPLAAVTIGNRVALAAALMAGQGIAEYQPGTSAAKEIAALGEEIVSQWLPRQ